LGTLELLFLHDYLTGSLTGEILIEEEGMLQLGKLSGGGFLELQNPD